MPEDDSTPPVSCTITDDRARERADWMGDALVPVYLDATARSDGVTVRFAGADDTLEAVGRFVAEEKECCAFADYRIEISPPYDETRLAVTGPDGTRAMFAEEFVPRLAGEKPLHPPD